MASPFFEDLSDLTREEVLTHLRSQRSVWPNQHDLFRPYAEIDLLSNSRAPLVLFPHGLDGQFPGSEGDLPEILLDMSYFPRKDVLIQEKSSDLKCTRSVVDLVLCADLVDLTADHNSDLVPQDEGLLSGP